MVMYLTCDVCDEWGHKDSAHQYEMIDGEIICEKCQIAGLTNPAKLAMESPMSADIDTSRVFRAGSGSTKFNNRSLRKVARSSEISREVQR